MFKQLCVCCPFQFDDAVAAKELALTDSEHSDAEVSYTDNGTFNLSRGQTPLTEGSEGEAHTRDLSPWNTNVSHGPLLANVT